MSDIIKWENRNKKIRDLIKELQSFEDKNLIVMVTNDEGETFNSVKLVSKGFVPSKDDSNKDEQIYCALHI
ncbi:hypothetical protein CPI27_09100 [Moraxella catarrhalis]|uniref:hypothetical protein n=1 Tax=Moraxella catarrhalis TaxID=480 RepID=UPI00128DE489|nr:hypothetical protein [Moraxella catarrhalis]MPX24786.1 hypothetical protein [Moraxella catarrhalis]